jgi:hypothetical protein
MKPYSTPGKAMVRSDARALYRVPDLAFFFICVRGTKGPVGGPIPPLPPIGTTPEPPILQKTFLWGLGRDAVYNMINAKWWRPTWRVGILETTSMVDVTASVSPADPYLYVDQFTHTSHDVRPWFLAQDILPTVWTGWLTKKEAQAFVAEDHIEDINGYISLDWVSPFLPPPPPPPTPPPIFNWTLIQNRVGGRFLFPGDAGFMIWNTLNEWLPKIRAMGAKPPGCEVILASDFQFFKEIVDPTQALPGDQDQVVADIVANGWRYYGAFHNAALFAHDDPNNYNNFVAVDATRGKVDVELENWANLSWPGSDRSAPTPPPGLALNQIKYLEQCAIYVNSGFQRWGKYPNPSN